MASLSGMRSKATQIDLGAAVGDDRAPADLARQLGEELLRERHQVVVGGVGLVELEHGELGVVLARQPLVAEVAADLVDPLEAAHHQAA